VHEYIAKVTPIAQQVEEFLESHIPLLLQCLLWNWMGRYVKGNNYFGIKGEGQSFKTHELSRRESSSDGFVS